jgi:ubiquinone/menaquinone biosynthesis C-methylase UbiE
MKILDATAGFRMMHFNKDDPRVTYFDIRSDKQLAVDLQRVPNRKPWNPKIKTVQGDYRCLPFQDNYFDLIYFDPSHFINVGKTGIYYVKYGKLNKETWREDLTKAAAELWRVLKPGHSLNFKWNTQDIPYKEVLKLFPAVPVAGQRTVGGQGSNRGKPRTFWFSFAKDDDLN